MKKNKMYAVFGLGRYGSAVALELAASGADVTVAYNVSDLPETFLNSDDVNKDYYYSFEVDNGRVTEINVNPKEGVHNLSMNIFVVEREKLIAHIFLK